MRPDPDPTPFPPFRTSQSAVNRSPAEVRHVYRQANHEAADAPVRDHRRIGRDRRDSVSATSARCERSRRRRCGPGPEDSRTVSDSVDTLHRIGRRGLRRAGPQACYVDWCGCPGMIWPQSGDSVDLLTTDEKLKGMEVLAKTARKLSTTALCLGVQGKDTAEMLMFAEHVEKLAPPAIISRPPDSGKTEDDLRQYWQALAAVTKRPVFIQTTGGVAYKGPIPSVDLLIELAKRLPQLRLREGGSGQRHRSHACPARGQTADPARLQRPRRIRLALRIATRLGRIDHRACHLRRRSHPHLETAPRAARIRRPFGMRTANSCSCST